MAKGTTYLETVKHGLVKKLFNTEILTRPDVTSADICRVIGISTAQLYRWFKKFGFDVANNYKNEKSTEEIENIIWQTLSGEQIERVYSWIKEKRFNEKVAPKTRTYHMSEEALEARRNAHKRTKEDEKNELATNAKAIANAGIPQVHEAPVPKQAKAKPSTIENVLHDFMTTNTATEQQRENLINNLLFGEPAKTRAVKIMASNARHESNFNAVQWAFEQMYNTAGRQATSSFFQVVQGLEKEEAIAGRKNPERLLKAYRQNKSKIDLDALQ